MRHSEVVRALGCESVTLYSWLKKVPALEFASGRGQRDWSPDDVFAASIVNRLTTYGQPTELADRALRIWRANGAQKSGFLIGLAYPFEDRGDDWFSFGRITFGYLRESQRDVIPRDGLIVDLGLLWSQTAKALERCAA